MSVKLYVLPGSHPCAAVQAALEPSRFPTGVWICCR